MTVSSETRSVRYQGDGVTTVFSYTFLIPTTDEITVRVYDTVTETWDTLTSGEYSLSGAGNPAGGTVTYNPSGTPIPSTKYIYIARQVGYTQDLDISENGGFDSSVLEAQLDDIVFQVQQLKDIANASPSLEAPDSFTEPLPPIEDLKGKVLLFDTTTGNPTGGPTADEVENAQGYAQAAAAAYDAFDDRYLGSKASDPTLDNDGNALLTGALYWNTTNNVMRVYNGASWSDVSTTASLSDYTATGDGSTTTFATGNALPASENNVFVWIDGVRQYPTSDYTLSGNSVVFTSAPYNGAAILIIGLNVVDIGTPSNDTVGVDQLNDAEIPEIRGFLGVDILSGFRNKIINGDFDIWQRATSQTSSSYGSADRWRNIHSGSTKTASQQSFTPGQTDVPGNPKYYMRHVVTTGSGSSDYVIQLTKIEGVKTLSGKTATLTFYAKADSSKNIAVEITQNFGSGGSPSSSNLAMHVETVALTASWSKISFTIDIDSISGKTLGTDGNDYLEVVFWFDAGSDSNSRTNSLGNQSGTFDIAHVSLVEGDATNEDDPFSPRHVQQESLLCKRYYNKLAFLRATLGDGTGTANMDVSVPQLRASPTITFTTVIGTGVSVSYNLTGSLVRVSGAVSGSAPNRRVDVTDIELNAEL
jgi:hypothetical protein